MRSVPLYERLATALLAEISAGRLRPGDRIPSEQELGRAHGVSRITVRHALGLLRDQGLLERYPRRGSFISRQGRPAVWTIASIQDVLQVSAETDAEVGDWLAVRDARVAGRLGRPPGERLYRYRGLRSDAGTPVYYVEAWTAASIGRGLRREDFARSTLLELIEDKLGLPVASGEEEISAGAADPALARRLHLPVGAPVLVLDLTYFGVDGRPLEHTRLWYHADKFRRRNRLARRLPAPDRLVDGAGVPWTPALPRGAGHAGGPDSGRRTR
jgi:GntR family transcriptional regulator